MVILDIQAKKRYNINVKNKKEMKSYIAERTK